MTPLEFFNRNFELNKPYQRVNHEAVKKKISNTLTEITKLSDNEQEKNETFISLDDSLLLYGKSSATSLCSEFKNELTFTDSDNSSFGDIKMLTKINRKVRFKKVQFNLNNSNANY